MGNLTGKEQSEICQHAQTKWWSNRQETESSGVKPAIVTGSLSLQTNLKKINILPPKTSPEGGTQGKS